jgi:hypothetical protein
MEHGLVAWPEVHVIRERLALLRQACVAVARQVRARLGLSSSANTRSTRRVSPVDPRRRGVDPRTPQPLSAFPVLQSLVADDGWFADPHVRVQRMWERDGWDGQPCAYFIARRANSAAGLLIRGVELEYCRLYPSYTLAAVDGLFWHREAAIRQEPAPRRWRGADERGRPWMIRVIARPRRWELHLAHGGILPQVCSFSSQEEALGYAEIFMRSPLTTRQ